MEAQQPTLWMIAGPNGAGKTTYAFRQIERISGSINFVNLDEIARGLSPLRPNAARFRAARIALQMQQDFLDKRESFSLETTLSGMTYLGLIRRARDAGFIIRLQFFSVPSPEVSLQRVAKRVSRGGHDVPEADVRRRFSRSHANFFRYAAEVDDWLVWENGGSKAVGLAAGKAGCLSYNVSRNSRGGSKRYGHLPANFREQLEAMPLCAPEPLPRL